MDSGERGSTETSLCPDLSALKNQEALFNKRKAENLSDQNPLQTCTDLSKTGTRSSARFGALSHHSFFSRHNPHPQRVTHLQGLNGNPVCMVNDDWYTSSPLCPHPLIASQVSRSYTGPPLALFGPLHQQPSSKAGAALLSEAWKEELKDITAKVSLSTQTKKDRKEVAASGDTGWEEDPVLSPDGPHPPPPTRSSVRYGTQASLRRRGTHGPAPTQLLHDQELMVLELLCQILQTDSLHLLQQWLLFAGQKEKDLVMGLLQQAMADASFPGQPHTLGQSGSSRSGAPLPPPCLSPIDHKQTQHRRSRSYQTLELAEDTPERIGEAEVLQINTGECAKPYSCTEEKPQQC